MKNPNQAIEDWFFNLRAVRAVVALSRKIILPGFEGIPLYNVAVFFIRGLSEGYLTLRAASISYSFFLAIFPFLIFLFSIIPFIPVRNFQPQLLGIIQDFMPQLAYESVKDTIVDIVTRPRSSLLIFNLVLTLYFSTNGVSRLMDAFANTYHSVKSRSNFRQYLVSGLIVIINSLLLITAIGLMTAGPAILAWILPDAIRNSAFNVLVIDLLRWGIILTLLLTAISLVYSLAPARSITFRFFSPGSIVATTLIVVTTLGFNFWVDNFSRYNAFYGSLGTLIVVLVWIYVNAISLLVGFELNASINTARRI